MDIGAAMNALRDPAGVPGQPVVFQVLMVLTWALHIVFVHLALGSAGLAIFAFHRRDKGNKGDKNDKNDKGNKGNESSKGRDAAQYWPRLSMALTQVAKVSVSMLIVLGVAPLLFTQVIYDPQWYVSNVLSGRWAIAFILTLIVAYCCWFAFYYGNREHARRRVGLYAWIALALFCMDGLIMHALAYQALLPQHWAGWYAPGGYVDTRGAALHAIEWPRYLFIMSLSVPTVGVFLLAYATYFAARADSDAGYLQFARALGQRIAQWGFLLSAALMLAWQWSEASRPALVRHPLGWLLVLMLLALAFWMQRLGKHPATRPGAHAHGYLALACTGLLQVVLATWREVVRIHYLAPFGYDIDTYKVSTDWPSTVLFFLTLAGIGGLVGGFFVTLLYRSGRTAGHYVAERQVARLGVGAVAVLVLWIAVFFGYGILISLRDGSI